MAMEQQDQTNFLLNWTHLYPQKSISMDGSLLLTMELQEQLKSRDQQILHLKNLLAAAIEDRDQAQQNCTKMLYEKLLLQHSTIEDDPTKGIHGFSSSDSDESTVSSPVETEPDFPVPADRALPENGKFLEAVMKAGPLLQTLLLAGPLPQWRHPPPPVDACLIPAPPIQLLHQDSLQNMNKCGRITRKRKCVDEYESVVLH